MDSLAVSQQLSDLWLPLFWPLRRPTAIICSWVSAVWLWRAQRVVSLPCFHVEKWKVHHPLLIAVPPGLKQPQLNTGQSWLPANLSNKPESSFSLQRMLSDFSSPMSHSLWHPLPGTQNYCVYTGKVASGWPEQHMCEHLSFTATCGNSLGFAFYFPWILSDKCEYLYFFSPHSSAKIQQKGLCPPCIGKFLHIFKYTFDDSAQ